jgi:hypothetical protein
MVALLKLNEMRSILIKVDEMKFLRKRWTRKFRDVFVLMDLVS